MALDPIKQLRDYIDDQKTGREMFDDPELEDYISVNGDLHSAAAELWGIKAARVSSWYQVNIDGSFLSREQAFEHCIKMQHYHAGLGSSSSGSLGYTSSEPIFTGSVNLSSEF